MSILTKSDINSIENDARLDARNNNELILLHYKKVREATRKSYEKIQAIDDCYTNAFYKERERLNIEAIERIK